MPLTFTKPTVFKKTLVIPFIKEQQKQTKNRHWILWYKNNLVSLKIKPLNFSMHSNNATSSVDKWWMPRDLTDDKRTLVQEMAWCRQATSHYLNQCWPSCMRPQCVTRPQWVKRLHASSNKSHEILLCVPTNPASLRPIMTPSLLIEVCIDAIHVRVQGFKDFIAVQSWQVHKCNTNTDIIQTMTQQCVRI